MISWRQFTDARELSERNASTAVKTAVMLAAFLAVYAAGVSVAVVILCAGLLGAALQLAARKEAGA